MLLLSKTTSKIFPRESSEKKRPPFLCFYSTAPDYIIEKRQSIPLHMSSNDDAEISCNDQEALDKKNDETTDNAANDNDNDGDDEDEYDPQYFTLKRNSEWRGSTFHMVFQGGSAFLDVKVDNPADGTGAKITNSSFDGEGCLRFEYPFPADLALKLLQMVPQEKDKVVVDKGDDIGNEVEQYYISILDKVPEDWRWSFVDCDVILNEDQVKHLLPDRH